MKKKRYSHFLMPDDLSEFANGLGPLIPQTRPKALSLIGVKNELEKESDRGCVLVSAAFIESELTSLLLSFLVPQSAPANQDIFGLNGPLGTFSSKIKMAYACGLLEPSVRHDIDKIRSLRNEFAHLFEPMDFSTPEIKSRVLDLQLNRLSEETNTRSRFIQDVVMIAASLVLSVEMTRNQTPSTHVISNILSEVEEYEIEIAARKLMAITSPCITYDEAKQMAELIKDIPVK